LNLLTLSMHNYFGFQIFPLNLVRKSKVIAYRHLMINTQLQLHRYSLDHRSFDAALMSMDSGLLDVTIASCEH